MCKFYLGNITGISFLICGRWNFTKFINFYEILMAVRRKILKKNVYVWRNSLFLLIIYNPSFSLTKLPHNPGQYLTSGISRKEKNYKQWHCHQFIWFEFSKLLIIQLLFSVPYKLRWHSLQMSMNFVITPCMYDWHLA